jgi:hypothetical protein
MSSTSSTTLSARPFNRSPPTKSGITSSTSSGSAAIQHPDRLKTPSKKNTIAGSRTPTSIFKPHHPAPSAGGPIAATLYVDHYNTMRLHSAIGYVTPQDRLAGRQAEIHVARDRKLEAARSPAATSPAADGAFEVCTLFHPSYNDLAGRNGSRHCRDATMLRDNLVGLIEPMLSSAGTHPLALRTARKKPSDDRPSCLENPRPEGAELTLTENAVFPFHAEPSMCSRSIRARTQARWPIVFITMFCRSSARICVLRPGASSWNCDRRWLQRQMSSLVL